MLRLQNGPPSVYKYFNNWGMCFSCGFNVPGWHTSMTCSHECHNPGHQVGCTRQNYQQYLTAGHTVNRKKVAKNMLPSAPTERQARHTGAASGLYGQPSIVINETLTLYPTHLKKLIEPSKFCSPSNITDDDDDRTTVTSISDTTPQGWEDAGGG